jgi:hypothetical protein
LPPRRAGVDCPCRLMAGHSWARPSPSRGGGRAFACVGHVPQQPSGEDAPDSLASAVAGRYTPHPPEECGRVERRLGVAADPSSVRRTGPPSPGLYLPPDVPAAEYQYSPLNTLVFRRAWSAGHGAEDGAGTNPAGPAEVPPTAEGHPLRDHRPGGVPPAAEPGPCGPGACGGGPPAVQSAAIPPVAGDRAPTFRPAQQAAACNLVLHPRLVEDRDSTSLVMRPRRVWSGLRGVWGPAGPGYCSTRTRPQTRDPGPRPGPPHPGLDPASVSRRVKSARRGRGQPPRDGVPFRLRRAWCRRPGEAEAA